MKAKPYKISILRFFYDDWGFQLGLTLSLLGDTMILHKAGKEVYRGNGNQLFDLGFVDIPKFVGANATNLAVVILFVGVFVALIIGQIMRYRYYRDELYLLKKAGLSNYESSYYKDYGASNDD